MSSFDPFDLSEQEAQAEAQKTRERLDSEQRIADWKWLLSNKRGRRLIWALLEETGMYHPSFTGNANQTFFNEGKRNIGLLVMSQVMSAAPERYVEMIQEHKQ